MSYTRGRFGVEYDATRQRNGDDRHLLGWSLAAIAVLALVSFVSARGCARRVKLPDFTPPAPVAPVDPVPDKPAADVPAAPSRAQSAKPVPAARPKAAPPKPVVSEATRLVERWLANSEDRPPMERTLLEKLLAAERAGNAALALDTIERLRQRPAMADLDEPLARRLGALNFQRLLSRRPTPWTTTVTTRRGDSPYRIAREHGTTVAAVLKLNNLSPEAKLTPGTALRVLEFPRAALVVHRQTKQADLTLNGKFFKRYYASTGAATKPGSFQVTREAGPRTRFKDLGIVFAPTDLDEIAMLLPPGASIVVADP